MSVLNIVGQTFGRLTVVQYSKKSKYLCKCKCGNYAYILRSSLLLNRTLSCGCLRKETAKQTGKNCKKQNNYLLLDDYGIGFTHKNTQFLFDLEDYKKIKDVYWIENNSGYLFGKIDGLSISLHRFITDCPSNRVVDHINHNKLDNRKSNLRICTSTENNHNLKKSKRNSSGTAGVYWHSKARKWAASIGVNYKTIYLGTFKNKQDAINARRNAEEKYFNK